MRPGCRHRIERVSWSRHTWSRRAGVPLVDRRDADGRSGHGEAGSTGGQVERLVPLLLLMVVTEASGDDTPVSAERDGVGSELTGADEDERSVSAAATVTAGPDAGRPPRDLQRTFQLVLATVWLLDAVLQIQPFMFTRGMNGFSGQLHAVATGNPGWVAHTITWNASVVYHHPVLTDSVFAGIQFLIAIGIIYPHTIRPALALSVLWATAVWWFGEGLGGIASGRATPIGGGPGGVLFYVVLAVLLWPSDGSDRPFVAARTVGVTAARAIWAVMWAVLALLCLVGSGRSPRALHDLVADMNSGQPAWLARIDDSSASLLSHHGTAVAILLTVICLVAAGGVLLPPPGMQFVIVVVVVVFLLIWIAVQNVGGILAGGATDPNSGLPVVLIALIYWPLTAVPTTVSPGLALTAREA